MITESSRFQALREKFLTGLERRLSHLSGCVTALRTPLDVQRTGAVIEEMTLAFHSLAGIGGSFGFPDITTIARLGEQTCRALRGPVRPNHVATFAEIVDALITAGDSAFVTGHDATFPDPRVFGAQTSNESSPHAN